MKEMAFARVCRHIGASPEEVFDAWLDPELARKCFGPGLGEVTRSEIDLRIGGTFWLVQRREDGEAQHSGEYVEMDPPRRLVFSWCAPAETDSTRVIIDIAAAETGRNLTLTHELNPKWQAFVPRAEATWLKMIDGISTALATRIEGASPEQIQTR